MTLYIYLLRYNVISKTLINSEDLHKYDVMTFFFLIFFFYINIFDFLCIHN